MTTWTRAAVDTLCGGTCGRRTIPAGEPMQVLELPAIKRSFFRCVACAGEAPPDLPARVEREPLPGLRAFDKRLSEMTRVGELPFLAPREPGQEG